jgi:hypothetical protein
MAVGIDSFPTVGSHNDVHTTQSNALGTVAKFSDGNTYIYLKGVTSNADGLTVVYQPGVWTAILIATGVKGCVAISQAAVDASTKFGWFLIVGSDVTVTRTALTSNTPLYAGGVSGYVDVAAVKGDQIIGMHCRNAAGAVGSAQLQISRATIGHSNESVG